jgi:outer membrane protein assembly factor BamD (BamD/ComL family)
MGLVLASLTAVPILVSMLYRFPFSLIFTFIIGFVAMLPWLAITVTLCSFLARWRPLRFSFHYATALIALLPVLAYYALATRNAQVSMVLPPAEMTKLYLPWVLAVVAAFIFMALALTLAWIVNYRPGAIAPLLAIMFIAPVLLFEIKVGRDEVYYRLLENQYGPDSQTCFVDNVDASRLIASEIRERLGDGDSQAADEDLVREQVLLEWRLAVAAELLGQQQYEAIRAMEAFKAKFPQSRYIPNVLYLKGRAADMRLDRRALRESMILRYYSSFPSPASRSTWASLCEAFPDSRLWIAGAYRLAQLSGRDGQIDHAIELLDALLSRYRADDPTPLQTPNHRSWRAFLAKAAPSDRLAINRERVYLSAWKLHDLLVNNRDPQQNDAALRRLLSLDPQHPMYRLNLQRLQAGIPDQHPLTALADNVRVLVAASERSLSRRIEALRACVAALLKTPDSDALPQARYELGWAYKQDNRPVEAKAAFEEVVRLHPGTPWAVEARSRLASMGITGRVVE